MNCAELEMQSACNQSGFTLYSIHIKLNQASEQIKFSLRYMYIRQWMDQMYSHHSNGFP